MPAAAMTIPSQRGTNLFLGAVVATLALAGAGLTLADPWLGTVACASLLVFGLPHGTLDLELIRANKIAGNRSLRAITLLYLGCAAAMWAVWQIAPVTALAIFICIAVAHFSEDWEGSGSLFLNQGLALAILSVPTFFNRAELDAIFVALTSAAGATHVADGLTLVAPVALCLGLVAIALLWEARRIDQALGAIGALVAMAFLPPLIGFALFFCLFHSPRHFRAGLVVLARLRFAQWRSVVLPLTVLASSLSAILWLLESRIGTQEQMIAVSFMTLSILTVPHMAVPLILALLSRDHAAPSLMQRLS